MLLQIDSVCLLDCTGNCRSLDSSVEVFHR